MRHTFATTEPVELLLEIQAGTMTVHASPTTEVALDVTAHGGDDHAVTVERAGRQIRVIGPRGIGLFRRGSHIDIRASVPEGTDLVVRTGSADLQVTGSIADVDIRTGSGDMAIGLTTGSVRATAGSGDVRLGSVAADAAINAGSGDIVIERAGGRVLVKSGSGDVVVRTCAADVSATTGSGDIHLGRLTVGTTTVRTGTGDVLVAVTDGVPVWTDIAAGGGVTSTLTPRGEPGPGQPFVTVRGQVGTGSVRLIDAGTDA
jgi:DUF4097 and DUF4098 domain-containing protein YvlB